MVSVDFLFVYVKVVQVQDVSNPPNLALGTHQCVVIANVKKSAVMLVREK